MDANEFPVSRAGEASEGVSQTQKPLHHTSGGEKKQIFPSKNSNLFSRAKKKVPQKEFPAQRVCSGLGTGCAQGIPKGWELSQPGFILSKGFMFHAEEAEKLQLNWKNPSGARAAAVGPTQTEAPWIQPLKNGNKGREKGKMNCTKPCTNHSFPEQDMKIHLFVSP